MKEKFIRILSPVTIGVVILLDIAVIAYGIFAVQKIMQERSMMVIFFAAIEALAVMVAALVTKEVFTNGVIIRDDEIEFTGMDSNNLYNLEDIVRVETQKDDRPSLVKNFVDRHAKIILYLTDDRVATIDIGLTTKHTLNKIKNAIENAGEFKP